MRLAVAVAGPQALGKVMGAELPKIPGGTNTVLYPASAKASTDLQVGPRMGTSRGTQGRGPRWPQKGRGLQGGSGWGWGTQGHGRTGAVPHSGSRVMGQQANGTTGALSHSGIGHQGYA